MSYNVDQIDKLLKFNDKVNAKLIFSQINSTNQQTLSRLVGMSYLSMYLF
jgi:hypothetical protein